ncbi:hypothetical protein BBP40_002901 [Aspergillus hancockii]|nr:hypothetical protein BBP40_002901 [Aspergillus hancockii]
MTLLAYLTRLLLLLAIFDGSVLARRGGGDHDSDSDSDSSSNNSDDDSSSGGSDGSSSSSGCGSGSPSTSLSNTYLVPVNARNWTSQSGAFATASPSIYDGSYFYGEGYLSYDMNRTAGDECRDAKQLRVLGYAWIGPQPPYPKGPRNPFIIGFKAWQSNNAVSDIFTSYPLIIWNEASCPSEPDLFRVVTTTDYGSAAVDTMSMNVSTISTTPGAVQFNATTMTDPDPKIDKYDGLFRLRHGSCLSIDTSMSWPDTTVMQGSVTNTTLELKFSGSVDINASQYESFTSRYKDFKVNFTVTFSGQFDSANSTHALNVQQGNQSLEWVANSAADIVSGGWGYMLVWTVGIQIMIWNLW